MQQEHLQTAYFKLKSLKIYFIVRKKKKKSLGWDCTWHMCTACFCRYLEGNVVSGDAMGSLECNNTGYFQYTQSEIKNKYHTFQVSITYCHSKTSNKMTTKRFQREICTWIKFRIP